MKTKLLGLVAACGLALLLAASPAKAQLYSEDFFTNGAGAHIAVTPYVFLGPPSPDLLPYQLPAGADANVNFIIHEMTTGVTIYKSAYAQIYYTSATSAPVITLAALSYDVPEGNWDIFWQVLRQHLNGGAGDANLDISVTATPLPASLPLFATGLGALGLLGWRRKRKAQAAA